MGAFNQILTPDMLEEIRRKNAISNIPAPAAPQPQLSGPGYIPQNLPPAPPPPPAGEAPVIAQPPTPQYTPDTLARIPSEVAPYAQEKATNSPAYQALIDFRQGNQMPLQGDYHPSIGRRILAGALGGFAGFGGAKDGAAVAGKVLNGPLQQKQNDYSIKLAQKEQEYKEENEQKKLEADLGDKAAQEEQRKANAVRAKAQADKALREGTPEWVAANTRAAHVPIPIPVKIVLKNDKTIDGSRTVSPDGIITIKSADGTVVGPDAYKDVKTHDAPETKAPDQRAIEAWEKENGRKAGYADLVKIQHELAETKQTDAKEDYYKNNAATNSLRQTVLQNTNAGNASGVVDNDVESQKRNSQYLYSIKDPKQQGLVKAKMAELGMPVPRQLSTKQNDHKDIANRSMSAANNVEKLTKDPDIANNIGSIMGQWDASTRHFIGQTPGLSPEVQKKVQMYRTSLEQLFSNEVQAVSNASAREGLQRANKEMKGTPRDILPVIQGIIAQTKSYANDSLEEIRKAEGLPGAATPQDEVNDRLLQFLNSKKKVQ